MNLFKNIKFPWLSKTPNTIEKQYPTTKEDAVAYANGGKLTAKADYNTYVSSVEALENAMRVFVNVASMAKMEVKREVSGELKPLRVKNVDLEYNINELDSQSEFLKKVFSSVAAHGASYVVAAEDSKTKLIMFYTYDPAKMRINATENNMIDSYDYLSEGGSYVNFKPEDVIYVPDSINVGNILYPVSRLAALTDLLTLQTNVLGQQTNYYAAGGKNSVIISPKEPIGADKAVALKDSFNTFIQTTAVKAMFLNADVDVTTVSNAQTPNQIFEALGKINTQVIQSFGVPEYLLGNYKGYVSDAAVDKAAKLFFQIQLKPIFRNLEHGFTKYFRNTLGIKNAVIKFNYNDVEILEDSLDTKITLGERLYKLGAISINELREYAELPPLPEASAEYHHLPAYLQSGNPISLENYDTAIANQATNNSTPSGSSGGADNVPVDSTNTNNGGVQ